MKKQTSVVQFKVLYHFLILVSIGFAVFLYSDDYTIFPWAKQEEALKFLHLITTIPIPLVIAFLINGEINREKIGVRGKIVKYFPIICLVLISGFIFLIDSLNEIILQVGFGVSIILFLFEMYLITFDFEIIN